MVAQELRSDAAFSDAAFSDVVAFSDLAATGGSRGCGAASTDAAWLLSKCCCCAAERSR